MGKMRNGITMEVANPDKRINNNKANSIPSPAVVIVFLILEPILDLFQKDKSP